MTTSGCECAITDTSRRETTVLAWHGDATLQAQYLERVKEHRRLDQLVAGAAGEGGRGCAVWCTFDVYDHSRGPVEIGVPTELMHLNDFVFEALPRGSDAQMGWPERFLSAAEPGADLRLVWDRFTFWILTEEHPDRGKHCAKMGTLVARHIAGDTPTTEEWDQAAWDAWAAWDARDARDARAARAAWAARDARDARAARAAWAAWDARAAAAAWDARAAARAAAAAWDARAAWAARDASISRMADKLIQLIESAPVAP